LSVPPFKIALQFCIIPITKFLWNFERRNYEAVSKECKRFAESEVNFNDNAGSSNGKLNELFAHSSCKQLSLANSTSRALSTMRDRLMVGHSPLEASILVRIQVPQHKMDKTFCIFGDSVTQAAYVKVGWVELLRQYLEKKYPGDFINVFNLGIGGNTSDDIVRRFDAEASFREPTDLIFAFGVNDSGYFRVPSKPIVEESRFVSNVESLVDKAKNITKNISFVGLTIGDDSLLQPFPGSSQGKSYTRDRVVTYDRIIKRISDQSLCRYIHLMDKLNVEDFLDGLHPNEEGHRKMFEVIKMYF
jgi:acyl-CoA thioesterase I